MSETWIYGPNECGQWDSELYENREDAIADGKDEAKDYGWDMLYIAKAEHVTPRILIDVDEILYLTACEINASRSCEVDLGESFVKDITKEQKKLLQEKLNKAAKEWLKEINYVSSAYICEDTEEIPLDLPEVESK